MSVFKNETKQAILQRMLEATPADIDKRQGSITYDLLSPAAIELAHAYIELDNVLRFGFAGPGQPSEFLDLRAGEFGLTRRPSVKAQGAVTFLGADGTVIPVGTAVSTDDVEAIAFATTEAGTITGGRVTVAAEARQGGRSGNVAIGRIALLLGDLTGVVAVANEHSFVNGADTESDESLLQRYFDRVRRPATSGNAWHYRQWALEVPGVGDVKVFPVWNGNGTVKLSLLSDDKRAPAASIVDKVRLAVEERRPVGANVTVVPATEVAINVSASLTLAQGAALDDIVAAFSSELTAYLADLAFADSVVRYNRVLGLLLDIESIIDFNDLKINGVAGNIFIVDDRVAVSGTVSFVAS
ncbi:baseplate J/gp47 family protein [Paenibacillus arenilitoris]|uniref:Baseplate J/gp47 family protein n=1 Tax=Paenibacillus arenilitoris TaxID=2772299 RepID=A0A927CGM1_9BACL|nr:baseplate J/gp47 family protein [Paenibacillus arenilitoris]MBD2867734.1 baseplate J/gp47 family protein [Paenibacillus arenilitoris]